jgi:hypothetical protein
MKENDNVYIPACLSPNNFLFFATDNTDLQINTPDGRNQLHGTAIAVYQQQNSEYTNTIIRCKVEDNTVINKFTTA